MSTGRAAALAIICLLLAGAATAQTWRERNEATARCYREAQRSAGTPPRGHARPGDDLVAMERSRRDYEDRYYSALNRCLDQAERRFREKRP